jgi:hypothetical protein
MRQFLTIFMVVVACLCLVQSTLAWNPPKTNDRNECFKRNRDVGNAIETFCWKNKDMVSSVRDITNPPLPHTIY